ncbi:MAG: wax ester/triacylglycerol synthase family O-acyltransferase [Proteobacteria bacterium]|nr:wax ester/triacylglycerol synthase family O-acyltransferase [Pseudomonadota bacterium]
MAKMPVWPAGFGQASGGGMASRKRAAAAGGQHERMSAVDTAWLRMDGPASTMMIVSVMTTATPVPAGDLRRVLETRLLCFPRFRKRVETDPLGASWIEDSSFDLDAHFVVTGLPGKGGRHELQALAARLASQRFDPARPLWQLHFVEHYGTGSAWVLRLHHCYADGIAMIRVLLSLTEQDAGPALAGAHAAESHAAPRRRRRGAADPLQLLDWISQLTQPAGDIVESVLAEGARLLETGVHKLFHPETAAAVALQARGMVGEFARVVALPDDPVSPLRAPLSGEKRVSWSEPLDLQEVRTVSRALGCTVNDVLMSTVAGALGAYLRAEGFETTDVVLRASVPVNLREADEASTLGNKFGLLFVALPVGVVNPLQRVYTMHDTMRDLKGSQQPPLTLTVLGLLGVMPNLVQGPAIELFSRKGSLVASNVPGPQAPLYLCGQRIAEMHFWVPQSGSIGVGVSILSYAGKVFFGLIADRACIAEPAQLVERLGPEFEQLLLATTVGVLGLQQRKPRRRKRAAQPAGNT